MYKSVRFILCIIQLVEEKFMFTVRTFLDVVPEPSAASSIISLVLPIALLVLMGYFMLYRPQKKQEKTVNEMRSNLRVNDEISTNGGIIGKIMQIKDDFVIIETSTAKTKMKIAKWAIRAVEYREEDGEKENEKE